MYISNGLFDVIYINGDTVEVYDELNNLIARMTLSEFQDILAGRSVFDNQFCLMYVEDGNLVVFADHCACLLNKPVEELF